MAPAAFETALDWWQRSEEALQREREYLMAEPETEPTDAAEAAKRFLEGSSGISYVDAVWKHEGLERRRECLRRRRHSHHPRQQQQHQAPQHPSLRYPVVWLEGRVAKTSTLRSLAARFVVATSGFSGSAKAPMVVILDSSGGLSWTASVALEGAVRAALGHEGRLRDCLQRIHAATTEDAAGWIPLLEALRHRLSQEREHTPTLLLWDGYGEEPPAYPGEDTTTRPEVLRQLARLLDDCPHVALVLASSPSSQAPGASQLWQGLQALAGRGATASHGPSPSVPRRAVHRILLQQRSGKDCFAVVSLPEQQSRRTNLTLFHQTQSNQIPRKQQHFSFSISSTGILS